MFHFVPSIAVFSERIQKKTFFPSIASLSEQNRTQRRCTHQIQWNKYQSDKKGKNWVAASSVLILASVCHSTLTHTALKLIHVQELYCFISVHGKLNGLMCSLSAFCIYVYLFFQIIFAYRTSQHYSLGLLPTLPTKQKLLILCFVSREEFSIYSF